MLSPDKRKRLIALLGMIGSNADGEALNAARMAQRLIGGEAMTWEEVFESAGGGNGADPKVLQRRYMAGYEDGYRVGLAKGHATSPPKATPMPNGWQGLTRTLLRDCHLSDWETGFCESFVERGWDVPTPKQRFVFERMAKKFDLDLPE